MAIKISGSTIIDDSRVIVNADKIGIGTPSPTRELSILSSNPNPTGIGVSAANLQSTGVNKAISVFNAGITSTFSVSYTGIVTANEYFGTFKGTIDTGAAIDNANKIKINHNSTNDFFNVPFFSVGLSNGAYGDIQYDNANSLQYNPSLGNLRINSGAGNTALIIRTTSNELDRAIAFQNSGFAYVGALGFVDRSGNQADLAFFTGNANNNLGTLSETMRLTKESTVGIGTTRPDGLLHVFGGDAIVTSGSVGIGTTTPGTDLHISGTGQNGIRIDTDATGLSFHNHSEFMGFMGNDSGKLFINAGGTQDTLSLRTGGVERLRIDSDGNVGLGTISPGASLHISTTLPQIRLTDTDSGDIHHFISGSGSALVLKADEGQDDGATDTTIRFHIDTDEKMRITSAGDVGIGTHNPIGVNALTNNTTTLAVGIVTANEYFGTFKGTIDPETAADRIEKGNTKAQVVDTGSDGHFLVETEGTERLRISSTGRVAIGTDDPIYRLEVLEDGGLTSTIGSASTIVRFTNKSGTGSNGDLNLTIYDKKIGLVGTENWRGTEKRIEYNVDDNANKRMWIGFLNETTNTSDNIIRFGEAYDTEWMRIDNGNVGIGSTIPAEKFVVSNNAGNVTSLVEAIAGDALLNLSNSGNGNYSGINFIRERKNDQTGKVGGSIFMPSNTSNNEAFLYIQTQSANADAGDTDPLDPNNGVRLKLHGDDGIFSIETGDSERLRIAADGKVGIGTDNPADILHIHSSGPGIRLSDSGNLGDNNPDPSPYAFAYFDANAANAIIHADKGNDKDDSRVAFAVDNSEKVRISSGGSLFVGVTTTSNNEKFVVDGNAKIEGALTLHKNNPTISLSDSDDNPDYQIGNINGALRFQDTTSNATRLIVDTTGNIGVNSANPAAKLDIFKVYNGLGVGNAAARIYGTDSAVAETGIRFVEKGSNLHTSSTAYLMRGISNGTTQFVFGANGNVGIGNTIPLVKLDVNGDIRVSSKIQLRELPGGSFLDFDDDNSAVPFPGGTNNVTLASISGMNLIYDTNNNDNNGFIIAHGNPNSGIATAVMVIDENDRVGIGTENPDAPLHILSDSNNMLQIESTDRHSTLYLIDTIGSSYIQNDSGNLRFGTGGGASAAGGETEAVRITTAGDVGIGTHNPTGVNALTNNNKTLAVGILTANQIFGPITGALNPTGDLNVDGVVTATSFASTVETGTAPFVVASTTKVTNLNADLLDDKSTANSKVGNTVVTRNAAGGFSAGDVTFDNITGAAATFSGNVSIAGTLTYEDVTNVDSIGIITARDKIKLIAAEGQIEATGATGLTLNASDSSAYARIRVAGDTRLHIKSDGKVGIGTDNPDQKLHVYNSAGDVTSFVEAVAGDAILDISNTGNGNFSGINFTRERKTGSVPVIGGSISMPSDTSSNQALLFIQTQSANAGVGKTGELSDNNGVRLKLASQPNGITADSAFTIEMGSSEAFRIDNSGNVGIGTSIPTGVNAVAGNTAKLAVGIVTASEYFGTFKGTIDSGVAIENANKIQVNTNSTDSDFTIPFVDSTASNDSYQDLLIDGDVSTSLRFNASDGRLQINGTGRDLLTIRTTNNNADRAIAFQNSGNSYVGALGFINRGEHQADLAFFTGSLNATLSNVTETMRLTKESTVGIGTTRPDGLLHVFDGNAIVTGGKVGIGTGNPLAELEVYRDDAGLGNIVNIEQDGTGDAVLGFAIKGTAAWQFGIDNDDGDKFKVSYDGAGLDSNTSVTLDRTGKVGIGTATPASMLHIHSGTPRITMSDSGTGAHHRINADSSVGNFNFDIDYDSFTSTPAFIVNIKGDEKLRVTSGGDVGIGTFNPTATNALTHNNTTLAVGIVTANEVYGTFKGSIDSGVAIENANNINITNDEDIGDTAHYIHFGDATSGYDGVKVDSTGLVYKDSQFGLGTASPGASLHISSTLPRIRLTDTNDSNIDHFISGSGSALHFQADENQEDGATATTIRFSIDADEKMRINASGQVGIGTDNPLQKLNVYNPSSSDTGGILVQNVGYSGGVDKPYLIVGTKNWTGATTNWNTFGFQHRIKSTNPGGVPRVTIDSVNGELFSVDNSGKVGIGTSFPVAKLDVRGGAISATFENNVGIGSTIPTAKLDLIGNTKFQGDVSLTRGTTRDTLTRTLSIGGARNQGNHFAAIELKNYDSDSTPVVDYVAAKITGTVPPSPNNGGELVFYTSPTGGDPAGITIQERLRITAGGNVGIGTDNPLGTNAVANNNKTLAVGILTANQIFGSVTGSLITDGNVDIDGNLDVDGTTTLDGLTVSEAAVFQNNLTVSGTSTFGTSGEAVISDNGNITATAITISDGQPGLFFVDTGADPDFVLQNRNGTFAIRDTSTNNNRFFVNAENGDVTVTGGLDVDGTANLDDVDIDGNLDVDGLTNLDHVNIAGITTIDAGAFAGGNISTAGRSIQSAVDIRSHSLRGGIVVRNMNNFREETSNAGFQVLDPYDSSDTSFAFRAAEGTTLVDNFWVKTSGDGYFSGNVGIGTSVPNQKLHIEHDSFHQILLKRVGAFPSEAIFSNAGAYTNISNNATGIRFLTGGSPISAMVIRNDRNVGIGTDNAISSNALTDNNATLAVGIVTANEVYGTFKGTIDSGVAIENANKIKTIREQEDESYFLTFVDSNNTSGNYEELHTDGGISYNPANNELTINGGRVFSNQLIAGQGTGSVAMTVNDGYGNANIAFNHRNGTPDINGSSGRIEVGVDTNTNYPNGELATMVFELYPQVTAGSPTGGAGTNKILDFSKHSTPTDSNTFIRFHQDIIPNAHNTFDFGRNGNRIAVGYFKSIGADVGIGTNNPDQTLHVYKGSAGSVASDSNAVITVENSDDSVIQMLSPADKSNSIMFGDPDSTSVGQISYDHNNDHLSFKVNGGDKLTIDDNGHLLRGTSGQNIGESSSRWNDIFATNGDFSGDLTVGGTLTYEDVTNIESVGIITAKDGIHVTGAGVSVAGISTFLDKVGVGNTSPNATLEVNGPIKTNSGSYTTPRRLISSTGDIRTDVALVMPTDSAIYTEHSIAGVGTFLRRLIGEFGDGVIEIGQHSTQIIKEIRAQAGDTGFFSIYNDDEEKLRVNKDGIVLQGDNVASTDLHGPQTTVGRTPRYQLHGANASTAGAALMSWSSSTGAYYSPTLYLARSGSGTTGTNAIIPASQTFGSILFSGDDGTNFVKGAMITGELDGTPGTSDMPGRLEFHTTPDESQEPLERLRIDSTGAVRINTTRSGTELGDTKLHVVGGTASGTSYDTAVFAGGQNSTAGSGARIYLTGCENDPLIRGVMLQALMTDNGNTHDFIIRVGGPISSTEGERLRITTAGDVGIGSAIPTDAVTSDNTAKLAVGIVTANEYYGTFKGTIGSDIAIEKADTVKITNDTSGSGTHYIHFGDESTTDNYDGVEVDSTGLVYRDDKFGIGTDNPDQKLHVMKGSAGTVTSDDNAVITVENNDHSIIQILSPSDRSGRIMFGSPDGGSSPGQIVYDHNANPEKLAFNVGGSTRVAINTEGNLTLTSGPGTQFKGLQLVKADGGTVAQLVGHGSDNDEGGLNLWDSTKKVQILANGESYLNGGNVGINTDNPNKRLDVFGSFRVKDESGKENLQIDGANGVFKVFQSKAAWTSVTYSPSPILAWDFKKGPGDLMYMASGGNTPIGNQMALVVSDNHGFKVGRAGYDGSDFDVSDTAEYLRVTIEGNVGIGTSIPTGVNAVVGNTATLAVGILTANQIFGPITGAITPTGNVDIGGNLDVDGTTTLDGLTVDGEISSGDITISDANPTLTFTDTSGTPNNPDFRIIGNAGKLAIQDIQDSHAERFVISSGGLINIQTDLDVGRDLKVSGVSTFVGNAQFNGNVSIGGTLTYEDVTNIESVGIITAKNDIHVIGIGTQMGVGTDNPQKKLHVFTALGDTSPAVPLLLERTNSNNNVVIQYKNTAASMYAGLAGSGAKGWGVGTASNVGGASGNKFMIMRSTGNVGIGTNDPDAILHIHSSAPGIRLSDSGNVGDDDPDPSAYAFAYFDANAANAIIHADKGDDVNNSRVAFAVDNKEKMRIDHNGKVGIGTDLGSEPPSDRILTICSEENSHNYLSIQSGSAKFSGIVFGHQTGNTTDNYRSFIRHSNVDDSLNFHTNSDSTPKFSITTTGAFAIGGVSNYGTAGKVLTSNGNAAPSWEDAGGTGISTTARSTLPGSPLTSSDFGKLIIGTVTGLQIGVPQNVFTPGEYVSFYNQTTGIISLSTASTVTVHLSGSNVSLSGSQVIKLSPRALATLTCIVGGFSPEFVISGGGVYV